MVMDTGADFSKPTYCTGPLKDMQARQAAVQRAQAARGFSYLLGKSDRLVSVAGPSALLGIAFFALATGAANMYTKPGSN